VSAHTPGMRELEEHCVAARTNRRGRA
jgi:hypothetical protein